VRRVEREDGFARFRGASWADAKSGKTFFLLAHSIGHVSDGLISAAVAIH
jgi:hypothetical protein